MPTVRGRIGFAWVVPTLVMMLPALLPGPAAADVGDISVGGVWVCRLTKGASGLTLEERVRLIDRRIADVLSQSDVRTPQIALEVHQVGAAAAIVVAGVTVMTVTPDDAAGTGVPVNEVANQWGSRLAAGLRRALPGRQVIARMYGTPAEPITGTTWYWRGTELNDGSEFVPGDPGRYTVVLSPGGGLTVRADCNTVIGKYALGSGTLTLSLGPTSLVACPPGSLDRRFVTQLHNVNGFFWRGKLLYFQLKYDSGSMAFSKTLPPAAHVTGTVTYRARVALPPDAIVIVQLANISRADAPAAVLGQQTIDTGGYQVPFAFDVQYDPSKISRNATIVVRATIRAGERVLFTTAAPPRVITEGHPNRGIQIEVQPVS